MNQLLHERARPAGIGLERPRHRLTVSEQRERFLRRLHARGWRLRERTRAKTERARRGGNERPEQKVTTLDAGRFLNGVGDLVELGLGVIEQLEVCTYAHGRFGWSEESRSIRPAAEPSSSP